MSGETPDAQRGDIARRTNLGPDLPRSCQQKDCSDGVWMPARGLAIQPPAPYLQLQVEMTSDGVTEPELRALHLKTR